MTRVVLRILTTTALVAAPLASASAQTFVTNGMPTMFSGTGLGAVATVLTLQGQGNNTIEVGCVGRGAGGDFVGPNGTGTCMAGPETDVNDGASQTQLLSALGITSTSQLGILFNASEPPGGGENGITLQSLTATFFSPTGALVGTPILLTSSFTTANTLTGAGNSGFLFTVSGPAFALPEGTRIGLSATVGCTTPTANCLAATGGQETFFVVNAAGGTVIPEPSTYMLLGTGLAALGMVARRRRTNA